MTEATPINNRLEETQSHDVARDSREDKFLLALLTGKPIAQACEAAGIGRSTGWRLRQDPEFMKRFREARSELLASTISRLHSDSLDFAASLHTIAVDGAAKGNDRVNASRAGLELLLKSIQTVDIEARLRELERIAGEDAK